MRHAGRVNQCAINLGFSHATPGVTLREIDEIMERYIIEAGCKPAFKNYQPDGYPFPFPATACISPNDVVVHGVPGDYTLKDGDLLTIDVGSECDGWFVDAARSRVIGTNKEAEKLVEATDAILAAQLSVIKNNCSFLEIIDAAEQEARMRGVIVMPQWGGHYIGDKIHLPPFIPNVIDRNHSNLKQEVLEKHYRAQFLSTGDTICLEPVATTGNNDTITDGDQWTIRKTDKNLAAHTERCLLITETGYELLS